MITTKNWGTTQPLIQTPLVEMHRVTVRPGGFCSEHKHHGRANVFYVTRGALYVYVWSEGGAVKITRVLDEGSYFTVDPGHLHQFFSPSGAEALELYYPVLRGEDIERKTEGGVRLPVNI